MNKTKEEILNMPAGREMDKFIEAHLFRSMIYSDSYSPHDDKTGITNDILLSIPNYSTDISAAWEVEEQVFENGTMIDYLYWLKEIVKKDNSYDVDDWLLNYMIIHSNPLQKCKAALLSTIW